jgi:hypothetical protein
VGGERREAKRGERGAKRVLQRREREAHARRELARIVGEARKKAELEGEGAGGGTPSQIAGQRRSGRGAAAGRRDTRGGGGGRGARAHIAGARRRTTGPRSIAVTQGAGQGPTRTTRQEAATWPKGRTAEDAKGARGGGGPEAVDITTATVQRVMMGLYRGRPPE